MRAETTPLRSVPSLDELAERPELAAGLPPHAVNSLLGSCEAALTRYQRVRDLLLIRAAVGAGGAGRHAQPDLVRIEEAAALLGRSTDWLYRHSDSLPFTIQEGKGRRLRFSRSGIERFLRELPGSTA